MLKYIGYINPNDPADREALHGVPARDLTDEEAGDRRADILASGLYRDTSRGAATAKTADESPAEEQ